jgi:hypothetical protein
MAARHGYGYQESKIWSMVLMIRIDGHIERIYTRTSGHFLAPCFEGALEFREFYPEMVSAPRTRVTHFTDPEGRDVLIDAWLFVGYPDRLANDTLATMTPMIAPRVGHRP